MNEVPITDKPQSVSGPGAVLAAAREKRGLSVEEAAARLRLPVAIIQALESDAYERLPVRSYASGYIRSYAKLLEFDAEPLAAACAESENVSPVIDPFVSRPARQATSSDRHVKFMTFVVSALLIALSLLWLKSEYLNSANNVPPPPSVADTAPAEQSGAELATTALSYKYTIIEHGEPEPPPTFDQSPDQWSEPALSEPQDIDGAPADRLTLAVREPSWIEVVDSSGQQLFYALARAGQQLELSGQLPFRVVIGNADATTVQLGGEAIDIQPFNRQGVARFTIDHSGPYTAADAQ
jgi:cytoskeleton protein RodZ